ncbi:MAG: group 1 truncated hemoglobin [Planctomycetota bacterium]
MKLKGFVAAVALLAFAACSSGEKQPGPDSLYARMGGLNGIARATDEMVNRVLTDPEILANVELQKRAKPENVPGIKVQITNLLAGLAGGPETYHGRSMKDSHRGMQVTEKQWYAFIKDCRAGMEAAKIGGKEIEEMVVILERMKPEIVEVK